MSETAEIIRAIPEALKAVAWPIAIGFSAWIMRVPLRALIGKITKVAIEHGDTKAQLEIASEVTQAAQALPPVADEQARTSRITVEAKSESKASIHPRLIDPKKEKEQAVGLRALTGNALKNLEELISIAERVPRPALQVSWEILSKNLIKTAKFIGFSRPEEEGGSLLSQAVFYLTGVLESQEFMIGVYALLAALQKVRDNPDADVSAKDAQDFVRACMTILSRLTLTLEDKELPPSEAGSFDPADPGSGS